MLHHAISHLPRYARDQSTGLYIVAGKKASYIAFEHVPRVKVHCRVSVRQQDSKLRQSMPEAVSDSLPRSTGDVKVAWPHPTREDTHKYIINHYERILQATKKISFQFYSCIRIYVTG